MEAWDSGLEAGGDLRRFLDYAWIIEARPRALHYSELRCTEGALHA